MKATIESTGEIVMMEGLTEARLWEGVTAGGIRFLAYIPLVQVRMDEDNREFERELSEYHRPISARTMADLAALIVGAKDE